MTKVVWAAELDCALIGRANWHETLELLLCSPKEYRFVPRLTDRDTVLPVAAGHVMLSTWTLNGTTSSVSSAVFSPLEVAESPVSADQMLSTHWSASSSVGHWKM